MTDQTPKGGEATSLFGLDARKDLAQILGSAELVELWLPVFQWALLRYFESPKEVSGEEVGAEWVSALPLTARKTLPLTARKKAAEQIGAASFHLMRLLDQMDVDTRCVIEERLGEHAFAETLELARAGDEEHMYAFGRARMALCDLERLLASLHAVAVGMSGIQVPSGRKMEDKLARLGFTLWEALRTCGVKDSDAEGSHMHQAFEVIFAAGCIERNIPAFLESLRNWRRTTAEHGELPWAFTGSPRAI